jgi:hypothetical protein
LVALSAHTIAPKTAIESPRGDPGEPPAGEAIIAAAVSDGEARPSAIASRGGREERCSRCACIGSIVEKRRRASNILI